MTPLEQVLSFFSTQQEFADRLNEALIARGSEASVKQQNISYWLKKPETFPGEYCIATEQIVGGKVTRYQLRPDVFGESAGNPCPCAN